MAQLRDEIDRVFENAFRAFNWPLLGSEPGTWHGSSNMMFKPSVDITATDKNYSITVEVPGVDENDISLELVDRVLTINMPRCAVSERKGKVIEIQKAA